MLPARSTIDALNMDGTIEQNMNIVKIEVLTVIRMRRNRVQPKLRSSFARSVAAEVMNPRSPPPSTNRTPMPT